uniref:Ribosome biogenesis protein NOP53 n=1 Tax=Rhabditophanes sp. KR3021 TaxID=114890 RepID=A0AC35TT44_9BILA
MVKYMDTVEFSKLPHKMKMVFRARYLNLTFHRGYLQTNSKIQQRLAQLKSEKMKEEEDASLLNVEENIRPHEEKKKDSIGGRKDINKSKKKNGQEVKKESETGKDSVKEGRKMCGSKFVKKENDDPKSEIKKESLSEVNIGIDKKKEPEQEIQKNVETKKETELHLVKEMGKDKTKAKDLKTSKIDKVKEDKDTGDKSKVNNKIILDKQMASNFLKKEEKNSAKRVKTDYKDDEIEESRSFMPPTVKKKVLAEEEAKEEKSEKRDMRADLLNSIKQRPSIKETSVVGLLDVNQSTTDLLKTCHKDVTPVVMRSAKGKPAPRRQTQFGMVRNEDKFNNAI